MKMLKMKGLKSGLNSRLKPCCEHPVLRGRGYSKNLFFVLLVIAVTAFFIASCSNKVADENPALPPSPSAPEAVPAPPGTPASEPAATATNTLKSFFNKGVGVECSYDVPGGDHKVVSFYGNEAHLTVTGPGATELFVTTDGVFVKSDQPGCDWISLSMESSSLPTMEEDWTLDDMERAYNVMYKNVHCEKKAMSQSDFVPSGKKCDMNAMMQQMAQ